MTKIKCENCEALNEKNSKFCEKCGNSLNQEKSIKSESNLTNKISCPFCGSKISSEIKKCSYCGEWLKPEYAENNSIITIGYVSIIISFLFSFNIYSGQTSLSGPDMFALVCIPLSIPLIIALYLINRKNSKSKKHGIILLITCVIIVILFSLLYLGDLAYQEEMRRSYDNYYYY